MVQYDEVFSLQGYYENHRDAMANAWAWYKTNDHCAPHFHHSIELVYVLEGELCATLDGREHRVGPRTMLINSSYTIHSYETPAFSRCIFAIIPMTAVPSIRQALSKQAFASVTCPDEADGALEKLMRMMVACLKNPVALKGLCYAVLGLLMERVGLAEARANGRAAFIREVLEYLQQHHTQPLSAKTVAARFGYSKSRFSHIFNAHLGHTLSACVNALRCQHAAQLLAETDMPVTDVAMAVGFESLRTFYRAFKNQYEMTPSQYKKPNITHHYSTN